MAARALIGARRGVAALAACAWLVGTAAGQTTSTTSSSGGTGSSLWHYCTWTKYEPEEDSPAARHGHSLVGYENKMVLFGGFDGAFSNTYMSDMWFWDVKPYTTTQEDAPAADAQDDLGSGETIGEKFDAGHWRVIKQTGTIPPGRYGHAAAVVENSDLMVVFGGNSGEEDLLSDLWVFHLKMQLWTAYQETSGSPWPTPRSGATGTDVGGTIYVFGGWSSRAGALAELWALDVAKDELGNPAGVTWTLLLDSCSSDKVREAQPERCMATDDAKCGGVDAAFRACQDWTYPTTRGRQVTSCPGSGGAGAPEGDCMFFHPNGTLPSGCAGRATVCARAGDCSYAAPNLTSASCECETLLECRVLEQSIATNWPLDEDEIELLGGSGYEKCKMQNGLAAVQERFDVLDVNEETNYLESTELSISLIRQKVPVTVDLDRDDRLSVTEYARLIGVPGPTCTAQDKDVCEAVTNDGTAATCEAAGRCTYYPAVSARSCDRGPSARFGHAAVKVSIDLMVFGGHDGQQYLNDLWRYDTLTLDWSAVDAPVDNSSPIRRSHLVAVPMSGGMLLWSGYTSLCNQDDIALDETDENGCLLNVDDSEGFLEDLWQFANPAGTAIQTSQTQVKTLTQVIELKEHTLIVEDKEPEWNKYTSHAAGSTGGGGTAESTPGADKDGRPYARKGSAAVALDFISGFGVFGGEGKEGLLGDTWVLRCGLTSNTLIVLIVLGAVVFLLLCYVGVRYYLRYKRQRAALTRVTELLKNIGRSGMLNRNGIHADAIAPLANWTYRDGEGVNGFFVPDGKLDPPLLLKYDASKLTLSKQFVDDQKAGSGKKHWVRCLSVLCDPTRAAQRSAQLVAHRVPEHHVFRRLTNLPAWLIGAGKAQAKHQGYERF